MSRLPGVPTILCILDGWGIAPDSNINGITAAKTPAWDRFIQTYPHGQLQASELSVGLPGGQMGNSEVGHMTIGAGRVIMQDLPRIDQSIQQGIFSDNPTWITFIDSIKKTKGACHLIGLLSPGGVHSHQSHIEFIVQLLKENNIPLNVHAILDGRDTPPQSAYTYLQEFSKRTDQPLSTIGGRYFAMDRDKRWDRIEKAYRTIAFAEGPRTADPLALLTEQYKLGVGDEFLLPHCVGKYQGIKDGDGLIMVNFRADRVRQILSAFLMQDFKDFDRGRQFMFGATLGLGAYSSELTALIPPMFPKVEAKTPLGAVVAEAGFRQLRIAETEKYAHVTFFINGGREEVFSNEDRILIPSPDVTTYDLKPEMSAEEITDRVVEVITTKRAQHEYALIIINYANTDMVGHTGVQEAIIKAVETIDHCLSRLEVAVKEAGYALLITADHGNVEQMVDKNTGQTHTAHTCNPVPIVLINAPSQFNTVSNGQLSDLAPTILTLMGLPIPSDMSGKSLLGEHLVHATA